MSYHIVEKMRFSSFVVHTAIVVLQFVFLWCRVPCAVCCGVPNFFVLLLENTRLALSTPLA